MCHITYTSLVLDEAAQSVTLSGTAVDCKEVAARIEAWTTEKQAGVDGSGGWTVVFSGNDFLPGQSLNELKEECGETVKVKVFCVDDPNCEGPADFILSCGDCPEVDITVTPGHCVNGRRTVHIRAEVVSASDATYSWQFGTDEDNQPGEDSQAGGWLPNPDANGVRVVEVDHVYEATGDQPRDVTVKLVTSSGPNSECVAEKTFTLEPCICDLTVSLWILDGQRRPVPASECLPPGNYTVEVTSPTGGGVGYFWSVNGTADDSQADRTFDFSIAAGEEKTISVFVEQGGCDGSNAVTVRGCGDCRDFDARLRILNSNRRDVTDENCLPPGDYTVQATSPTGAGNTFRWSVDNVVDDDATGSTLQVSLGEDDEKIITLEASRGECRDTVTVVLRTCPPQNGGGGGGDDGFIPCVMFKVLALLGLGFIILGAILLLCPLVAFPIPPQVAVGIAIGLLAVGALLLAIGLTLWILICQPDPCEWLAFLWQALMLLGLLMIYASFCPACSWMIFGGVSLIVGLILLDQWVGNCRPTRCRVLAELITLFTFVVNVVAALEVILAACVITTNPAASAIWGIAIGLIQAWLWSEANRNDCIRT